MSGMIIDNKPNCLLSFFGSIGMDTKIISLKATEILDIFEIEMVIGLNLQVGCIEDSCSSLGIYT